MPTNPTSSSLTAWNGLKLYPSGLKVIILVQTLVATILVVARFYWHLTRTRPFLWNWEDTWVFLATAFLITSSSLCTAIVPIIYSLEAFSKGLQPKPPENRIIFFLQSQSVIIVLFFNCIWSVKAAWVTFYRPLFENTFLWQRNVWKATTLMCLIGYIVCISTTFAASCAAGDFEFGCTNKASVESFNRSLYISTALDITTNISLISAPFSLLSGLRMSSKKKQGLAVLYLSAFVIIVISVARLSLMLRGSNERQNNNNVKWLVIFTTTEATLAVIISCAPALRRFLIARRHLPSNESPRGRSSLRQPETPALEWSTLGPNSRPDSLRNDSTPVHRRRDVFDDSRYIPRGAVRPLGSQARPTSGREPYEVNTPKCHPKLDNNSYPTEQLDSVKTCSESEEEV